MLAVDVTHDAILVDYRVHPGRLLVMLIDGIPVVQPPRAASVAPSLRTAKDAIALYGQPTLRQPAQGGGERLRWISLYETVLASMDVKTVDVDSSGHVVQASMRTVRMRDPASY